MKRVISWLLAASLAAVLAVPAAGAVYTDIPAGSALAGEVQRAIQYGLMEGYSAARFGYGDPMTRAQFVTVLGRMMNWAASPAENVITAAMELPENLSGYELEIRRGGRDHRIVGSIVGREALHVKDLSGHGRVVCMDCDHCSGQFSF